MKIRLIQTGYMSWQIQKLSERLSTPKDPYWVNYYEPQDISFISYESALRDYEDIRTNRKEDGRFRGFVVLKEDEVEKGEL